IIGQDQIEPGKQAYVQFRGEALFACARGDRYVVRSYSPMVTIGGGMVLDAAPARHKRKDPAVLAALIAKESGSPEDLLETWLQTAPVGGVRKEIMKSIGLGASDGSSAVKAIIDRGIAVVLDGDRLIHSAVMT